MSLLGILKETDGDRRPAQPLERAPSASAIETLAGGEAATAIARVLAPGGRGGIVIIARALAGRRVLFVRDEDVPVPEKYRDVVRFTRAELEQIVRERWSAEHLRAVVLVKEEFRSGEPQAQLVPADEAAEMRRTMVPAGEWLERSGEAAAPAASAPVRVAPTLEELCEERQAWLWRGFVGPSPEEPAW